MFVTFYVLKLKIIIVIDSVRNHGHARQRLEADRLYSEKGAEIMFGSKKSRESDIDDLIPIAQENNARNHL